MKKIYLLPFLVLLIACNTVNKSVDKSIKKLPSGDYFGLEATMEPQVFAEGIVSRGYQELNAVFSPDGNSFFYTLANTNRTFYTILYYKKNKTGQWEGPKVAPFSGSYSDADPCFSPDGSKLYFISKRPLDASSEEPKDFDIWMVEKTSAGWSAAKNLGAPINTDKNEYYVSVTNEGSLFYSANYKGRQGSSDIYEAKLVDGKYVVESLGEAINTNFSEGDPYISPDGNTLIFMSWGRPEGLGSGDLYISFKENGTWKKAVNMGPKVNSDQFEYCPMISPDGKYFFWTSYQSTPFHTKTPRTYEQYLKRLDSPDNGLGNIYWIKADIFEELK